MSRTTGAVICLTGVTGFLGKVVLEELFRCRSSYPFDKVVVLIRESRGESPSDRFHGKVAESPVFSRLPPDWEDDVQVLAADLDLPCCGVEVNDHADLLPRVTHIIHCAGCVSFDAPTSESLSNITAGLHVMELAQACPNLRRLVTASTAYVTPPREGAITEELHPLPRPAAEMFNALANGDDASNQSLLKMTGHPNMYTLSKCIAEHLLVAQRGTVPLTMVRPSIISASWQYPFPGWVDSLAGFTGHVAAFGVGILRVVAADPSTRLDIVPVDTVAQQLIEETFARQDGDGGDERAPSTTPPFRIVHSVATIEHTLPIVEQSNTTVAYFTEHPIYLKPKAAYIGRRGVKFRCYDFVHHVVPLEVQRLVAQIQRDEKKLKGVRKAKRALFVSNHLLISFTHTTYDFRTKKVALPSSFEPNEYVVGVCEGVRRFITERKPGKP